MKTDIVCLGDSIVFGYGAPAGGGWPERSARRLGKHIINSGENGDTTDEMLGRFEWDVVRYQPKEVVIMGGANDILMGIKQAHTRETVTLLVAPYAVLNNVFAALGLMLCFALCVIAAFTYYYSVAKGESFKKRFLEMAGLSFGVAAVSFLIGYLLQAWTGIQA